MTLDRSTVEVQGSDTVVEPELLTKATGPGPRRRVHILYLIDHVCQVTGGGEGALIKFIRHLPRDRFHVSVGTFKANPIRYVFDELECPLHVFPLDSVWSWKAANMAFKLRQLIRSEHVDIVHTFFETSNIWGGLVAKLSGGPLLISSRRDMGILRSAKHALAYRVMSPLFDRVLAVSQQVRNHCIRQERLDPQRVFVLYNGVELHRIPNDPAQATRASMGLLGASHIVTTVANIKPVKGLDILVRTAARVRCQFPRAVFLVVGDFHDKLYVAQLMRSIRELGVYDNVRLVGARDDIFPILRASDIFFLPSRSEGFSNALIESMACGLPAVATDVGGNSEALEHGRSGFLIPPNDPDTAADRILLLLHDALRRREMGAEARRVVESRFSADIMGQQLAELYDLLLSSRRSSNSSMGNDRY